MAQLQRYLTLAFSFVAAIQLHAQAPGLAGAESASRHVSVVPLPNPGADYSGLFVINNGQPTPIELKAGVRSKKLQLARGAKEVVLARQSMDSSGKLAYVTAASVPWPEAKSQDALLIIGSAAGTKEIKAMAVDDSPLAFPSETTRLINLTGVTLLAKVNNFQGELKHGAVSAPISYPDLKKLPPNSLARFPFAFAVQPAGGQLQKLGSGFWEAGAGRRSLVIIQPPLDANSKTLRVRTFVDYPAPLVPAPILR